MDKNKISTTLKRFDKPLAAAFVLLTIVFLIVGFMNKEIFDWAFARHQNQFSWYIRPLFLIPFCFFSYKRSLAGIAGTLFLLLTSMFWFPEPALIDKSVAVFLAMEKDYLTGDWNWAKIVTTILVPVSMTALAIAFWKRSLWMGIAVLVFIAVAKMLWSVVFGGESGQAVILPASIGLVVCIALITIGFVRMNKKKEKAEKAKSV